eukprot:COSAG01_NODE_3578_length_5914_cov_2.371625_8_plen_261_part_00
MADDTHAAAAKLLRLARCGDADGVATLLAQLEQQRSGVDKQSADRDGAPPGDGSDGDAVAAALRPSVGEVLAAAAAQGEPRTSAIHAAARAEELVVSDTPPPSKHGTKPQRTQAKAARDGEGEAARALGLLLDAHDASTPGPGAPRVAGVDERDAMGFTALHHAAIAGRVPSIALLLRRGADPLAETSPGLDLALHLACLGGHAEAVEVLLHAVGVVEPEQEGASSSPGRRRAPQPQLDVINREGWTPLHLAVLAGQVRC